MKLTKKGKPTDAQYISDNFSDDIRKSMVFSSEGELLELTTEDATLIAWAKTKGLK